MADNPDDKSVGSGSEPAPGEWTENGTASDEADPAPEADERQESEPLGRSISEADRAVAELQEPAALEEAEQRILRLQAELENYRKRTQRAMEEERRYASLPLLRDLLAVWDNLQRAIEAAEQHENATSLLDGVKMVAEQFSGVLKQHHCEPIEADGRPFDPNLHEAIAQYPSDDHEPGHVSQVTQVGYHLHDRVIRPAQVIVASEKPEA